MPGPPPAPEHFPFTRAAGPIIFRCMPNHLNTELESYAETFKALSNPNRLRIFLELVGCCAPGTRWSEEAGRACVGDFAKRLKLAPSTVSHHVKELHRAGLIRTERRGQTVELWIEPDVLSDLAGFFARPPAA